MNGGREGEGRGQREGREGGYNIIGKYMPKRKEEGNRKKGGSDELLSEKIYSSIMRWRRKCSMVCTYNFYMIFGHFRKFPYINVLGK